MSPFSRKIFRKSEIRSAKSDFAELFSIKKRGNHRAQTLKKKRKPRSENNPDGARFWERTGIYKPIREKNPSATALRGMNFERYSQPIQNSKRYF
jgi:hypothetical protein